MDAVGSTPGAEARATRFRRALLAANPIEALCWAGLLCVLVGADSGGLMLGWSDGRALGYQIWIIDVAPVRATLMVLGIVSGLLGPVVALALRGSRLAPHAWVAGAVGLLGYAGAIATRIHRLDPSAIPPVVTLGGVGVLGGNLLVMASRLVPPALRRDPPEPVRRGRVRTALPLAAVGIFGVLWPLAEPAWYPATAQLLARLRPPGWRAALDFTRWCAQRRGGDILALQLHALVELIDAARREPSRERGLALVDLYAWCAGTATDDLQPEAGLIDAILACGVEPDALAADPRIMVTWLGLHCAEHAANPAQAVPRCVGVALAQGPNGRTAVGRWFFKHWAAPARQLPLDARLRILVALQPSGRPGDDWFAFLACGAPRATILRWLRDHDPAVRRAGWAVAAALIRSPVPPSGMSLKGFKTGAGPVAFDPVADPGTQEPVLTQLEAQLATYEQRRIAMGWKTEGE